MEEKETRQETPTERPSYRVEKDWYIRPVDRKRERRKAALYILVASLFYTVGFHYFVGAARFAPGGVGGVVAMVQYSIGIAGTGGGVDFSSLLLLLLNIPLVLWAYRSFSRRFAVRSLLTTALMTVMLFLLDNVLDPTFRFSIGGVPMVQDMGTRILSAIFGGVMSGIALALSLLVNSSTGGADIVGAVLQKKHPHISVGSMILAVNGAIAVVSLFVYRDNLTPVFLSIIFSYISSVICDRIVQGGKSVVKFEVVTEYAEAMSRRMIEELGHAVTVIPAVGMFERREKSLLICLIRPRQMARFHEIIREYPDTFAYFGSVGEVVGKFNDGNQRPQNPKK